MIVLNRFSQMSSRLVFSLTVSALLFAISNLLSSGLDSNLPNFKNLCTAQGWLIQFSEISIFGWITTIALNLYLVVCRHLPTNRYEKFYHLGVWTWALFAACIPFVSGEGVYNTAGIWCWFSKSYPAYRFVLFYVPFILQVVIVLVFYVLIIRQIRMKEDAEALDKSKVGLLVNRLRAYPIIFFVLYLFPTVNRIYEAVSPTDSFPLYVLQCISAPSIGLVNAFAYGFDNDIRNMWSGILKRIISPTDFVNNTENPDPSHSEENISFEDPDESKTENISVTQSQN